MSDQQPTGSRARTRQAIIDAAIVLLGQNSAATLGEIAAAADVGRTTLHRYFAERAELLSAVSAEGGLRLEQANERARLAEGTGAEAVRRLCQEYFELGDLLSLLFSDQQLITDPAWADTDECSPAFEAAVRRGHHDGTIDPGLPAGWLENVLWAQLYASWSYVERGRISRYEVLRLTLRTLDGAMAGPR